MKKKIRKLYLIILDIALINIAFYIALYLRFEGVIPDQYLQAYLQNAIVITIIKVIVLDYFKLYKSLWEYASIEELAQIVIAAVVSNTAVISYLVIKQAHLPRSIYILTTMLDIFLIGGIRFSYRAFRKIKRSELSRKDEKRVMVIGAGDAGAMIIKELKNHTELNSKPVAIIDDDMKKEGQNINGVPILGQRYNGHKGTVLLCCNESNK